MFYEEKWIGEKLFWRGLPDGEWIEFTIGDYKRKVKQLQQQVKSVDLADVGERNSEKLWGIMADPSISKQTFDRLCELYDEICAPVNRGNYPVRIDINYI